MSEQFVYHRIPDPLEGRILYPMNQLEEKMPEIFAAHKKKYEGREELLQKKIPGLDCFWNDVLHFSTINPQLLVRALSGAGNAPENQVAWLKVPIEYFSDKKCLYYDSGRVKGLETFNDFDSSSYLELTEVPERTFSYYKSCIDSGKSPLLFVGIPHLLLLDEIDVTKFDSISWLE